MSATSGQGREPLNQPATIPLDFALALASAPGFGRDVDPQVLVGAIPEWALPRLYVPAGARVLGSSFVGSDLVAIFSVADTSDTLLGTVQQELIRRGWKPQPVYMRVYGGFRPPRSSNGRVSVERIGLCGDNQFLSAWIARRRLTSSTVITRVDELHANDLCGLPPIVDRSQPAWPTLYDPEQAARRPPSCARVNMSTSGIWNDLKTSMSPESLLDHYGRQLQDSGWVPTPHAIVGRTWTRGDSAGMPREEVTLTVITPPQDTTCRRVKLEVEQVHRP